MTADSAMGDPFPRFYLGPHLASTPKDNEVAVFQVPFQRSAKISTPACYGTNHAIAAGVEKFPPHPHDNRHHATNHTSTTTPALLLIHALDDCACDKHAHKKLFASMVPDRPTFDLEALQRQIKPNEEALQPLQ